MPERPGNRKEKKDTHKFLNLKKWLSFFCSHKFLNLKKWLSFFCLLVPTQISQPLSILMFTGLLSLSQ